MLKAKSLLRVCRRHKSRKPDHWVSKLMKNCSTLTAQFFQSNLQNKKFPKDRALESFDDFYSSVYGYRWKNMRVALLCERKYMALVNIFGDHEKTIQMLESEGAINMRAIYASAKENPTFLEASNDEEVGRSVLDEKLRRITQEEMENDPKLSQAIEEAKESSLESPAVDPKKSLERTLAEDSNLQHDRLISAENSSALYEFIPATKLKGMEDFVLESEHYKYYSDQVDFPLEFIKDTDVHFPETLNMYTFEKGNISPFKPPKRGSTGVFSHYLMDGASLLPPLVLGIKPGETVLDACAAPGGKSLIMLQTLYPETLICNDLQEGRLNRLKRVLNDFIYDFDKNWNNTRVKVTQHNVLNIRETEVYDKILVDVPCTTDRHVLHSDENNLFKPSRIKERLRIPETQSAILVKCLELLKPGGTLVYSTCSLSPVQNDGVVHMALSKAFKDCGITATIQ